MTTVIQRSFAGGELDPATHARVDQTKYAYGARRLRNWFVRASGGASTRAGWTFVAEVKDSSKTVLLVPFIFNADQTYLLEFGHLYMRVHRNGAQIQASSVTAWSNATAYVVGDLASRLGVNYYCIAAHTNQQPPNVTYWYPLTGTIYEIPTPYTEANLEELQGRLQSRDVVTLLHPSHDPYELAREGHTRWILSAKSFEPGISAPTNLAVSGVAGSAAEWVVTAISEDGEESLASSSVGANSVPSSGAPRTLTWTQHPDAARGYNVYRKTNGLYALLEIAGQDASPSYVDTGIDLDTSVTPPTARNPFTGADNKPSTGTYYQGRLILANTNTQPDRFFTSRSGHFGNFTFSVPSQEDDAITHTLAGRQVNEIRHMLDFTRLIFFTTGAEWAAYGDADGTLLPGAINARPQSYNGCSILPPLVVNGVPLYIQAKTSLYGSIVRTLDFNLEKDGYRGDDMTIFSKHLFNGYTIVDWDYQQNPDSIVWMVRSDGLLIGFTFVPEHQIWAMHRHDTDGLVENVCVIPDDQGDSLYLVVKRTINGTTKRYIERMEPRTLTETSDPKDFIAMDSAITYDGRNTDPTHEMEMSSGGGWTADDTITLTSSAAYFASGDVGNAIHMTLDGGAELRLRITGFTSDLIVTGKPHKTVPAAMRNVAITEWGRAVDVISDLSNLEAKQVTVYGDGSVVASPNNRTSPTNYRYSNLTVSGGSITLPKRYVVVHVGLPYLCDAETLDIDQLQGETLADKKKKVDFLTAFVEFSRGGFVGPKPPSDDVENPLEGIYEFKRVADDGVESPITLDTDKITIQLDPEWSAGGRVFIRQVDPIPFTLLAIAPSGFIPVGRQ